MGSCLFQNYMTPLRLVLSPADMAAIFINLEVRPPAQPSRCRLLTAVPAMGSWTATSLLAAWLAGAVG